MPMIWSSDAPVVKVERWLCGCLLLITAAGCGGINISFSGPAIQGSGVSKTEARPVAGFSRIDVGGAAKLEWRVGDSPSLDVTAEDNLLPHLITEVVGDTLKIHFRTHVAPTKEIVLKTASPGLDGFIGSGATVSTLEGIHSDGFKLGLSGSSRCSMTGQAKALSVECSGASAFTGSQLDAGTTTVATSGSATAEIRATGPKSIHESGASHVTVRQVNSEQISIDLSGSSQCTIAGQASKISIRAGGAATLDAAGLKAESVEVDLSGSSQVHVDVVQSLTGSASGSATVRYRGNPGSSAVRTSGSASVRPK